MNEPIWTPGPERVAASNLTRFAELARRRYGAPDGPYGALWRWSVGERERFWQALIEFAGIVRDEGTAPVLRDRERMPGAVWFEDTRLSYAENLLAGDDQPEAIVFVNERGTHRAMSRAELRLEVARIAAGLRDLGIGEGDRVAAFLPNLPESIVAMLAATSLGAVWTSCSPDFGINGVLDRFGQVTPRVLFTADGYFYGGKTFVRVVNEMPHVKDVAASNYAFLSAAANGDSIAVMCAIDNLMKGASGSAVQSMNLMMGWEETTGLEFMGLHPI